jgi:hypothetical protein
MSVYPNFAMSVAHPMRKLWLLKSDGLWPASFNKVLKVEVTKEAVYQQFVTTGPMVKNRISIGTKRKIYPFSQ